MRSQSLVEITTYFRAIAYSRVMGTKITPTSIGNVTSSEQSDQLISPRFLEDAVLVTPFHVQEANFDCGVAPPANLLEGPTRLEYNIRESLR